MPDDARLAVQKPATGEWTGTEASGKHMPRSRITNFLLPLFVPVALFGAEAGADRPQCCALARRRAQRRCHGLAALAAILLVVGCSSVGPASVTRDRFDYAVTVSDSWKHQMLVNLVKYRYGDSPMFLDLTSITSQYTLEGTLSGVGTINFFGVSVPTVAIGSVGLSAQGKWSDRPTITYSPLGGERFARSMMTPIPPTLILGLIQSGYPIDQVLRIATHGANGIRNRYGGEARSHPADPQWYELLALLRRIQVSGAIGTRIQKNERNEVILLTFSRRLDPAMEADVSAARRILGLRAGTGEFRVVFGSSAANDKEIAIHSRSMIEILIDLSTFISVPELHLAERRAMPTPEPDAGPSGPVPPLIRIASGREPAADAFVAVPYRGHWFWIDDRDIPSKRMFAFLWFLFNLLDTGVKNGKPVLTLPTGG